MSTNREKKRHMSMSTRPSRKKNRRPKRDGTQDATKFLPVGSGVGNSYPSPFIGPVPGCAFSAE